MERKDKTMCKKYREIMGHVKVSKKMKQRIVRNLKKKNRCCHKELLEQ